MDPTALWAKLSKGAARNGTKLTPAECNLLLRLLRPPPRRRGPKPNPKLDGRDASIAELVHLYEAKGDKIEAAMAQVMKLYEVTRSHVFACRARYTDFQYISKMNRQARSDLISSREDKNREANLQFLEQLEAAEDKSGQTASDLTSNEPALLRAVRGGRRRVQTFPEIIPGPLFCIPRCPGQGRSGGVQFLLETASP